MATLLFAKTNRVFLSMALDQAHEQNSADINSDGGAVGLTQYPRPSDAGWSLVLNW